MNSPCWVEQKEDRVVRPYLFVCIPSLSYIPNKRNIPVEEMCLVA